MVSSHFSPVTPSSLFFTNSSNPLHFWVCCCHCCHSSVFGLLPKLWALHEVEQALFTHHIWILVLGLEITSPTTMRKVSICRMTECHSKPCCFGISVSERDYWIFWKIKYLQMHKGTVMSLHSAWIYQKWNTTWWSTVRSMYWKSIQYTQMVSDDRAFWRNKSSHIIIKSKHTTGLRPRIIVNEAVGSPY
jgi:hypothetical protein